MNLTNVKFFAIKLTTFCLVTLLVFEFFSFVASKSNLLLFNEDPFYFTKKGIDWRSENSPWGVWHKINFTDRHQESCFDVNYQSNNVGARDDKDYGDELSSNSIILLGDSMAEGYGSDLKETFAKIVEQRTDRNVLNLSAAGNFGPVQQFIIYDQLGQHLPHNELIYIFIPSNDFTDNDINYWSDQLFRYRPYFKEKANFEYEISYPDNSIKTDNWGYWNHKDSINKFLKQFFYSANTLRTVRFIIQNWDNEEKNRNIESINKGYSYYFDDKDSIDGSLFFVKKFLLESSNLTKRTVMIVPRAKELIRVDQNKDYKDLYWFKKIKKITTETDTILIDLADHIPQNDPQGIYLECDGHWNKRGNDWAAEIYLNLIHQSK